MNTVIMMMPIILNTARDVSDDQHSARTTVARPRPIASRDYRMPSIRKTVTDVPIARPISDREPFVASQFVDGVQVLSED